MGGLYDIDTEQLSEIPFRNRTLKIGDVCKLDMDKPHEPFTTFVILGISYNKKHQFYTIKCARPYAYAHGPIATNGTTVLLGCEHFEISRSDPNSFNVEFLGSNKFVEVK